MYTTYILYSSKTRKYYTGQTSDLKHRIEEHNRGKTPYLKSGLSWELIYSKVFQNRQDAIEHEKYIKKRGAGRFLIGIKDLDG